MSKTTLSDYVLNEYNQLKGQLNLPSHIHEAFNNINIDNMQIPQDIWEEYSIIKHMYNIDYNKKQIQKYIPKVNETREDVAFFTTAVKTNQNFRNIGSYAGQTYSGDIQNISTSFRNFLQNPTVETKQRLFTAFGKSFDPKKLNQMYLFANGYLGFQKFAKQYGTDIKFVASSLNINNMYIQVTTKDNEIYLVGVDGKILKGGLPKDAIVYIEGEGFVTKDPTKNMVLDFINGRGGGIQLPTFKTLLGTMDLTLLQEKKALGVKYSLTSHLGDEKNGFAFNVGGSYVSHSHGDTALGFELGLSGYKMFSPKLQLGTGLNARGSVNKNRNKNFDYINGEASASLFAGYDLSHKTRLRGTVNVGIHPNNQAIGDVLQRAANGKDVKPQKIEHPMDVIKSMKGEDLIAKSAGFCFDIEHKFSQNLSFSSYGCYRKNSDRPSEKEYGLRLAYTF